MFDMQAIGLAKNKKTDANATNTRLALTNSGVGYILVPEGQLLGISGSL